MVERSPTAEKQNVLLIYRRYASSFTAYPWILARGGRLCVDAITRSEHVIKYSRWINEHIAVERDEDFIPRLLETLAAKKYTAVLCVDEPSRTLLLDNREIPELLEYLPFQPDSILNGVAVNKIDFQKWCEGLGIDCPRSVYLTNADEVAQAAGQFSFPFIVKGALGAGGMCVDLVTNENDLKAVIEANADRQGWILQEFVAGSVGTTGFVAGDQGLYAVCSVVNRICMGGGLGPSQIGQFWQDDHLREIAEKMTAIGGVRGLTGFDWILTPSGEYRVIDPHFGRAVPNMVVAHLDGIDLGEAYADLMTAQPAELRKSRDSGACSSDSGAYWLFPQCLQMIFEGGLWHALKEYAPWKKNTHLFFAGKKEWRLFFMQSLEFLWGHTRVVLGGIRKRLRR